MGQNSENADTAKPGLWSGLDFKRGFLTATVSIAIANVIALAIGFLAKSLQDAIDTPLFNRIDEAGTNGFTDVLATVTKMGNVPQTQLLAAVSAVALAGWFAVRETRWWMPLVVLPTAWIGARGFQMIQAKIVDRDREVIALIGTEVGSYPSGGVMRIILVTGVAGYLIVHYVGTTRRTMQLMFAGVALIGVVEGFARTRLNQHWFTDVVGGAIFGGLFLMVAIATIRAFDPDPHHTHVGGERN